MLGPIFVFAFVIATLIGALFHLVVGGNARRLALFLLAGWCGFVLGQILGVSFRVEIVTVGGLHIVASSVGAFFMLLMAHILTSGRSRRRARSSR